MTNTDPAEADLAWRGYSGWALLPSFVVCLVLSIALLTARWFVDEVRGVQEQTGSLIFFAIVGLIWVVQFVRWLYRGASYVYRLTPRHIYIDRGFLYSPDAPIRLAGIRRVAVGSNLLTRAFGVGWIEVDLESGDSICMTGLLDPAEFAKRIEAAMKNAHVESGEGESAQA